MKRILLFTFLTLLFHTAFAQDKIVKLTGDEIPARVLEITLQEVLYQHPDSLQGKTWRIPKADIFMVKYANGTKEVFTQSLPDEQSVKLTPEEMHQLGTEDAKRYYKGNGAMWGSAACSFIFVYGLAGSAAIALTKPRAHKNPALDKSLLSEPAYVSGYENRAHRKKIGKVAAGAGIGTATFLTLLYLSFCNEYGCN